MTLKQHREILVQAGWVALLVGCVEYDTGNRQAAETTRQAALSLGTEADHGEIIAWAHEMRAWINLTSGDYHGVIAAARAGTEVTPHHSVAVQLAAQEAKAWARIGDRRQTEVALDRGRRLLDSMPYPENLDHHFVVDPTKFDFYAMDCYRMLADDKMAENLADEVIQASTDFDGPERAPMRLAEARITLGVVAARQGDLDEAVSQGERALSGQRKSLPSLLMVSRDLTKVLNERYPAEARHPGNTSTSSTPSAQAPEPVPPGPDLSVRRSAAPLCENFLYGFKAARRAARAANTARTPPLPLALPLRRRQRRSAGAKARNSGRLTYSKAHQCGLGVPAPAGGLSGARQNPSRPSVTAGQPHPSSCPVNVHAKTTLTEPARSRSWQLSGAGTRVARDP